MAVHPAVLDAPEVARAARDVDERLRAPTGHVAQPEAERYILIIMAPDVEARIRARHEGADVGRGGEVAHDVGREDLQCE